MNKLLLAISFFLLMPLAGASTPQNRSALIIGIGHFAGPVSDLHGVPADVEMAKEMANAMGISNENITVLRDEQATKKKILEQIKIFSQKAADGGRVFIYFSGHGTRFLNPFINSCVEGLLSYDFETISNAEMAEATKFLNNTVDKSIMIVDTCHSAGVVNNKVRTRGILNPNLVPKFASKDKDGYEVCTPTNYRTRSLFDESKKLGAIEENVVYITSARPDEVSWDQPGKGGVATQALKECLLGSAKDTNNSGAVSLDEIEKCAQAIMNEKIPGPDQIASHITVRGNRNLIPVISEPAKLTQNNSQKQDSVKPVTQIASLNKVESQITKPVESKPEIVKQPAPNSSPIVQSPPSKPETEKIVNSTAKKEDLVAASLATLKDIESQRNPFRAVNVRASKSSLKINKDFLDLEIRAANDGYLYLILLGSDKKSFYVLYPNKLDSDNFIKANTLVKMPGESWQIRAAGPAGINNVLVMVSDSPRDLSRLGQFGEDPNSPFVYALNTLSGRKNLIEYMIGKNSEGGSEKFAAKLISISEVK
jgi:Caspase domain/Domain of unknown function (DUF4384)